MTLIMKPETRQVTNCYVSDWQGDKRDIAKEKCERLLVHLTYFQGQIMVRDS